MNTTIIAIACFCVGLLFGATFLAVCNTKAFEFQDNPSTRFQLQQQERTLERIEQNQRWYDEEKSERRNPCP